MQSFTDTYIGRRPAGMPEAQALIAIVLVPRKRCQPDSADNLFMYTDSTHKMLDSYRVQKVPRPQLSRRARPKLIWFSAVLSIALAWPMTAGLLQGLLYLLRHINNWCIVAIYDQLWPIASAV